MGELFKPQSFVYVLYSQKDHKMYLGYTPRLVYDRFFKHLNKKVLSTANRQPLQLIYFEVHCSQSDALRRERYFKTTAGKKALKLMLRDTLKQLKETS